MAHGYQARPAASLPAHARFALARLEWVRPVTAGLRVRDLALHYSQQMIVAVYVTAGIYRFMVNGPRQMPVRARDRRRPLPVVVGVAGPRRNNTPLFLPGLDRAVYDCLYGSMRVSSETRYRRLVILPTPGRCGPCYDAVSRSRQSLWIVI